MKKYITIAALLAAGTACAFGAELNWKATASYSLDKISQIGMGGIPNTDGYIITKTGGDTSPAKVTMEMEFTITRFGSLDSEHLISFGANDGTDANAYGFIIGNNGELSFGRMGTTNLTQSTAPVTLNTDVSYVEVAKLEANKNYTLTLVSKASGEKPGRGEDNFTITLEGGSVPITKTTAGFGMNGTHFVNLRIGSGISGTTLAGTVTSLSLVPEPSAFGLLAGIGALALVASRRRRK